jgi:hypothetical protein
MKRFLFFIIILMGFANSAWAQIVIIPDANFKNALINTNCVDTDYSGGGDADADTNNDGEIQVSEALAVEWLNVTDRGIYDMTGIEQFTNLKYFYCRHNNLTSLNIDLLTLMIGMDCSEQYITSLNVSNMNNLQHLFCAWNILTSIDVNNCPNLIEFYCSANPLETTIPLDLHDLVHLKYFECNYLRGSLAPDLLMSNLPELMWFQCEDSGQAGLLDLSIFPKLKYVHCPFNAITSLNLTGLTSLIQLNCGYNGLTTLDVQGLTSLQSLDCSNNPITCILGPLPNSLLSLNTQNTNITCLSNIPAGIAAANTLPICNNGCTYLTPTFHYTVACDNTITWTIDNAYGYTASSTLTNQNGIVLTSTTMPNISDIITLTCTNSAGQTISASQTFTMQDAVEPTFTYNFSNNGNTVTVFSATNGLPQNLTVSVAPSTTSAALHTAATANTTYTDAFAVSNTNITVCVQAVYSGFNGNPLNTVCKNLCKTIPAQNCATMAAHITGSNVQQGQPSLLTASAAFTPTASANYTYLWNGGSTNAALPVIPTTVATYTVTVTSDRGCTATATQKLPTWQIQQITALPCSTTTFCLPLICNKPIVNAAGLTFYIQLTGPVTSQPNMPSGTVTLNNAIVPAGITYANYDLTTNTTTIVVALTGSGLINTVNPLPNQVGCLNLVLNGAMPNDVITVTGSVEEDYGFGNTATFGLLPASITLVGATTFDGLLLNPRTTPPTPLHSNTAIIGTDASCITTIGTTLPNANGEFNLPITTAMTQLHIDRNINDPINTPFTDPAIINSLDYIAVMMYKSGALTIPSMHHALAADVDNSGTINASDATYISQRCTALNNRIDFFGRDWKFYKQSSLPTTFGLNNVPQIPVCLSLPNVLQSCTPVSDVFEGILIGDVNGSWSSTNEGSYRPSTPEHLTFDVPAMQTLPNNTYRIPVYSSTPTYGIDLRGFNIPTTIDTLYLENVMDNDTNNDFVITNNLITGTRRYAGFAAKPNMNGVGGTFGNTIIWLYIKTNVTPDNSFLQSLNTYINGLQSMTVVDTENSLPSNATFSIFPNPTNSNITIRTTNTDLVNQKIQLHDALGRLLETTTLQGTEQTIDLSEYAAGIYMLRIGNEMMKVVKQ